MPPEAEPEVNSEDENLQSEEDTSAQQVPTIVVKDRKSGQSVRINKADFNETRHQKLRVVAKAEDDATDTDPADDDEPAPKKEDKPAGRRGRGK